MRLKMSELQVCGCLPHHLRRQYAELLLEYLSEVCHLVEAGHHGGLGDVVVAALEQAVAVL